jgi:hypothetical protein
MECLGEAERFKSFKEMKMITKADGKLSTIIHHFSFLFLDN